MKVLLQLVTRLYGHFLHLFPSAFQREFADEMLIDFSAMVTDASKKGVLNLFGVILREFRDLPINIFYAHSKESAMNPTFRPEARREILQIMLAFGLMLALNTFAGIIAFVDNAHFIQILRFLHSIGWQGTYKDLQPFVMHLSALTLGPFVSSCILLLIFRELRPVKKYLPLCMMVFACPAVLSLIRTVLINPRSSTANMILYLGYYILAGMGFGILTSFISRERQKIPVFLIVGILGYFLLSLASGILILNVAHTPPASFWGGAMAVVFRNALIGLSMGLVLGLALEFKKSDSPPQIPV